MTADDIIKKLPYSEPFLFVDKIISVDEDSVVGEYFFNRKHTFYDGHFLNRPVTPGVILTETMAQIGVVCLGIFLLKNQITPETVISLTSTDIEFYKPVFPDEKVTVKSHKKYFRFGKLKCSVSMYNSRGEEVCGGTIAGMIK